MDNRGNRITLREHDFKPTKKATQQTLRFVYPNGSVTGHNHRTFQGTRCHLCQKPITMYGPKLGSDNGDHRPFVECQNHNFLAQGLFPRCGDSSAVHPT
jgi:hypothetical protein